MMDEEILKGKCTRMCPLSEQRRRQEQNRLSVFEILPITTRGSSRPRVDENKAVKEYSRPAAGKEIDLELIRPVEVLLKTIEYLINSVACRHDKSWSAIYSFVSNRIRAIKQDLTIQRCKCNKAVRVLELAARFYLYSESRMADTSTEEFDPVLNRDQLVDTMYKLFELYAREATDCSNRAEFESYYILYNLGVEHIKMEITLKAMQFSESPIFQHSLLICKAAWLKNYVRNAMQTMSIAYSSHKSKFPIKKLTQILQFKDYSLAEEFSTVHGFQVSSDQLIFTKKSLVTSQDRRFGTILSAKIDSNIGAIIAPS
ncbi:Germinal-center associated nuclear protein [Trichoplax sp. H2]|nr:Germinal-center associated nuclear protein [Trichoplax sp. H2]|eukprot:RDD39795.1 Germinal-center associated nuclear protein [Trichoplax sp. H2]